MYLYIDEGSLLGKRTNLFLKVKSSSQDSEPSEKKIGLDLNDIITVNQFFLFLCISFRPHRGSGSRQQTKCRDLSVKIHKLLYMIKVLIR